MASVLEPPTPSEPIKLEAPAPAEQVQDTEAVSMLPKIDTSREKELKQKAEAYTLSLRDVNVHSPEFAQKRAEIMALGERPIFESSLSASGLLNRSDTSVHGAKQTGDDNVQKVANTLTDLRNKIDDLSPNRNPDFMEQVMRFVPGGKNMLRGVKRYFKKYATARQHIDEIIRKLVEGQDNLRKDNASLQVEKEKLWATMGDIRDYIELSKQLDESLTSHISTLKAAGKNDVASALEADLLFEIRQRRQDLTTQLAVAIQGYLAMELIKKNNVELIKGVDRARTTTVFALETAVAISQALAQQGIVLDQIDALNKTTNDMILSTSQLLRQQTARTHEQAINSGVSVQTLQQAFDNIFATIDEIDKFKSQANEGMSKTIEALQSQVDRATPVLNRIREQETK